jgi:hypothetical protein
MSTQNVPSIGNTALARAIGRPLGVLRRAAPSELLELKEAFPDFAAIVDEARGDGIRLGRGPANAEFIARTWARALAAAEREFGQRLPHIRRKLDRADQVELASEVVAAVSGSALLGLLVGPGGRDGSEGLRVVAASTTLLGTLSALVARYLRRAPGGGSTVESYVRLTKLAAESTTLQVELSLWATSNGEPPGKGDELSARASSVLTEMRALLPNAG